MIGVGRVKKLLGSACNSSATGECADLAGQRIGWVIWGVPMLMFVLGILASTARGWLWTPALAAAGLACLANARRCGRTHCFFTGPFYLAAAALSFLKAWGLFPLPWSWIGLGLVVGTVLAFIPEWKRGRYIRRV